MQKLRGSFLVFFGVLLLGCGTASVNQPFQSALSEYRSGQQLLADGNYLAAVSRFDQAADYLTNNGKPHGDYYRYGYYQFLAEIQSASAYAEIMNGIGLLGEDDVGVAEPFFNVGKEKYRKTIMALRASGEQQRDVRLSDARFDRNIRLLMAAAATAVIAYGEAAGGAQSVDSQYPGRYTLEQHLDTLQQLAMAGYFEVEEVADFMDKRLPVDPAQTPIRMHVIPDQGVLSSIGRVVTAERQCTGSVVYPRIVLTNQHCFDGSPMAFLEEHIYKPVRRHRVIDAILPSESHEVMTGNDWMILILDESASAIKPIPVENVGSYSDLRADDRVFFVSGYSGDLEEGIYQTMHLNCSLIASISERGFEGHEVDGKVEFLNQYVKKFWNGGAVESDGGKVEILPLRALADVWVHNCDSSFGASGAPLVAFDVRSNTFSVVGLNQGALTDHPSNGALRGARLAVITSNFWDSLQTVIQNHPAIQQANTM